MLPALLALLILIFLQPWEGGTFSLPCYRRGEPKSPFQGHSAQPGFRLRSVCIGLCLKSKDFRNYAKLCPLSRLTNPHFLGCFPGFIIESPLSSKIPLSWTKRWFIIYPNPSLLHGAGLAWHQRSSNFLSPSQKRQVPGSCWGFCFLSNS